ncbi:DPP IV N-terminal domain-containing protein [Planctomycetaceae bacterium SH139]
MTRYPTATSFVVGVILSLGVGLEDARPQSPELAEWQQPTEARLKAIYESGEFRPRSFRSQWLPDSLGYFVLEVNGVTKKSAWVRYDVHSGEPVPEHTDGEPPVIGDSLLSPDGNRLLEHRGGDVFVRELASNERVQISPDASGRDVSFQKLAWSPDGSRIVFVESDSSDVRQRAVLVPDDPSYPGVNHRRFARVGEEIAKLRVGVVDADGQNLQWLPLESPDEGFYLGQVSWAGNSEEVLVEVLSRFRNQRSFFLATANELKLIFHEENEAWAVASQGKNLGLTWIDAGEKFVVVSEKDGWRHAYLYSREGQELSLLTAGDYDMIDRAAIDEAGGWYYFYASPDNATQKYLNRVPLDGTGKLERVTPDDQPGTHEYVFSPDFKWAFHTYSRLDVPPVVELVELPNHSIVRVLESNSQLQASMREIGASPTEFLELEIGNDISMDAWMIKPRDFDPEKKYPVLVYVYGEPHAQTVLDQWGAAQIDFHRVVADLGYLVVSIDNRGTPAPKGAAWRRAVFGSLGPLSTEEQKAGLQELGRMCPFVDLSRVGIWGWSGGGSNTLNALFRKPDSYHVGIAVVPKPQPHLYNAWFQEIFMRTRDVNREGYEQAAAMNYAEGLKGKLLIISGSGETNTHIQIIEGLVDRLIELGKSFDYMVYPNRDHGLREGDGTLVHVRMLIIRYLLEHLPPGPR